MWPYGFKAGLEPYDQLKGTETDNPPSQTALLLQSLFPSPEGVAFVPNQRKSFILNKLSSVQLGDLFARVSQGMAIQEIDGFLRPIVKKRQRQEASKFA